jgi:hypothetical protein
VSNGEVFDAREALGTGLGHVRLIGRKEVTCVVLEQSVADAVSRTFTLNDVNLTLITVLTQLRAHLPALPRLSQSWTLLYSLDQHGISISTLYNLSSRPLTKSSLSPAPSFLAIQDASGGVFGVFCGEGVQRREGSYYGGGESFMWKASAEGQVEVWKWTGRNDYVALCETGYLSFGGG